MKLLLVLILLISFVVIFINCSQTPETTDINDESYQEKYNKLKEALKNRKKHYKIDQVLSNHTLIRDALNARGYSEVKKSRSSNLKWSWSWDMLNPSSPNLIVNHFPNHNEIGSKKGLTTNLNNLYHRDQSLNSHISTIFPRSYDLSNLQQKESFIRDFNRGNSKLIGISNQDLLISENNNYMINEIQEEEKDNDPNLTVYPQQKHIDGNKNIWIVKPSSQARGVGIQIFTNLTQLLEYTKQGNDEYIAQKYVELPYTIKNTKFDIRQFVLVKSLNPLVIFKLKECYLRFCSVEYSTDNLNDRFVHLSNFQVQKEFLKDNKTPFPENQWSLDLFKNHLMEENNGKDIWRESLDEKIKKLIITTIKSWPNNSQNKGSFELLGFDILLSKDLEPLLLEVNTNPGLHLLTENVKIHHKIAIEDLFKVVLDNADKWEKDNNQYWINDLSKEEKIEHFGQWEPIYIGDYDPSVKPFEIVKMQSIKKVNKEN
ncbi:hypothetical protein DICPUDRAFT_34522 [Dictyostelium purpureum]|uniref:Tubulin-tyrosine ligase family protein n=1 Tax=Dictyostelium purpureum TaxID=5786 RepID=F0ZMU0_DICPU|nr:uncharacterized protein DICPUDRAFT_34522 [Dictyostelium purpureum]EGC34731.1 hypothetical protein DICPUDRAFT_34522 [Dictyostelium purpureum]|eukprot:XP_003288731.1 hypothetical protein DICPUDRAFT_34522 [Dictyostelium purpureum]